MRMGNRERSVKRKTRSAFVGDLDAAATQKRALRLRVGVRKAISISRCQRNFDATDSNYRQIAREGNAAIYEQLGLAPLNPVVLRSCSHSPPRGLSDRRQIRKSRRRFIQIRKLGAWTVSRSPTGTRPGPSFLKFRWKNQKEQERR